MATWYLGGAGDFFGPTGTQGMQDSERRRVDLQNALVCQQRAQHLSRAAQLRAQWQEVSERECRARHRNRLLLQDFQRAQDTLRDLAARTAAMRTIRVEYEKQLEQYFPRWQQRLKEKKLSVQRKEISHQQVELHLKDYHRRMEEDSDEELNSCAPYIYASPFIPQIHTPPPGGDSHLQPGKKAPVALGDYTQNAPPQQWSSVMYPSGLHPSVPQPGSLPQAGYLSQQTQHSPTNEPFDSHCPPPHRNTLVEPLPDWYGLYSRFPLGPQFGPSQVPWPGFHGMDPRGWGRGTRPEQEDQFDVTVPGRRWEREGGEDGVSCQEGTSSWRRQCKEGREKVGRNMLGLDIKPVRLSDAQGGTSETSSVCSETTRTQRKRRERKGRIQRSCTDKEGLIKALVGSVAATLTHHSEAARSPALHMGRTADMRANSSAERQMTGASSVSDGDIVTVPSAGETHQAESLSQEEGPETDERTEGVAETQQIGQEELCFTLKRRGEEIKEEEGGEDIGGDRREGVRDEGQEEMKQGDSEEETNNNGEVEMLTGARVDLGLGEVESRGNEGVSEHAEDQSEEEESGEMSAGEDGEEVQSSDMKGVAEGGEVTKGELEEEDEEKEGQCLEEKVEGPSGEDGQGEVSQNEDEKTEDERGGAGSLEKRGEVEEEEDENGENEDEEGIGESEGEGEERTAIQKAGTIDSKAEESEGETDSEDEIISSQLDSRKNQATVDCPEMGGKAGISGSMEKIEEDEEEEGEEDGEGNFDDAECGEDGEDMDEDEEDIEERLAPQGHSPEPLSLPVLDQKGPDPVPDLKGEPKQPASSHSTIREKKQNATVKTKALWRDSESDSGEGETEGRGQPTLSVEEPNDFDDFYD